MLSGLEGDRKLFSTRSLEGEFTTWTLVWSRDYGAVPNIDRGIVDNDGNCYMWDSGAGNSYARDRAGAEVNTINYNYWLIVQGRPATATMRFVLGVPGATPSQFDVWRILAIIFSRNTALDVVDLSTIQWIAISPNGRFILVLGDSIATGNLRHVLLYEGA